MEGTLKLTWQEKEMRANARTRQPKEGKAAREERQEEGQLHRVAGGNKGRAQHTKGREAAGARC